MTIAEEIMSAQVHWKIFGGSSHPALRRAAEFAQVWQPTQMSPEDFRAMVELLRPAR